MPSRLVVPLLVALLASASCKKGGKKTPADAARAFVAALGKRDLAAAKKLLPRSIKSLCKQVPRRQRKGCERDFDALLEGMRKQLQHMMPFVPKGYQPGEVRKLGGCRHPGTAVVKWARCYWVRPKGKPKAMGGPVMVLEVEGRWYPVIPVYQRPRPPAISHWAADWKNAYSK